MWPSGIPAGRPAVCGGANDVTGLRITRPDSRRRGFSLLESLIASAVLGVVVLAVGMAVSASQKASFEGDKAVLAAMAADDLMSELAAVPYANLPTYNGLTHPVGAMVTLGGQAYPDTYWALGRRVLVEDTRYTEPGLGVEIDGRRIVVTVFDDARDIVQIETFIPEPVS
ncbi:MAG: prepilin-type N-terminal cleavage/methylation domain-containing protein [Planctomycetota bacterium]|nr:MAG: prepilin-type N-terminal cleavage/methylation domain-containing protein [Planctomycetota bacterium]